jgi:hypothetical protein
VIEFVSGKLICGDISDFGRRSLAENLPGASAFDSLAIDLLPLGKLIQEGQCGFHDSLSWTRLLGASVSGENLRPNRKSVNLPADLDRRSEALFYYIEVADWENRRRGLSTVARSLLVKERLNPKSNI